MLANKKEESALIRAESLIRENQAIEAMEILQVYCEMCVTRLGLISESKECPIECKEAICSLIWSTHRVECQELHELLINCWTPKFGPRFIKEAQEDKEDCVNARIKHKLSVAIPEKYQVIAQLVEIANANNVEWSAEDSLALGGMAATGQVPTGFHAPSPAAPLPSLKDLGSSSGGSSSSGGGGGSGVPSKGGPPSSDAKEPDFDDLNARFSALNNAKKK